MNYHRLAKLQFIIGVSSLALLVISLLINAQSLPSQQVAEATTTKLTSQLAEVDTGSQELPQPEIKPTLEEIINSWAVELPAESAIVFKNLDGGESISVRQSTESTSASLYKLFMVYIIYQDIEEGRASLQTPIEEDNNYEGCLFDMIAWSDNDCAIAFGNKLGWSNIESRLQASGYNNTFLDILINDEEAEGDYRTTPEDVAKLLERLYQGELLNTDSSNAFIRLLEMQQINNRIPDLPDGVSVAHKTGDLEDVVHDVGYLTIDNETYLFVIMTSGWTNDNVLEAPGYFQELLSTIIENLT